MIPLGIGIAVSLLGDSTLYTVLPKPEIANQVGVNLAMVGILLGANRIVRLIFNLAAGALYDRLPRRGLLIGSLCLGVLSTLVFAISDGFLPLLLSRVLWGAAWSGLWIGGNAMVLDISNQQNRGRLSGQYHMWFFIGAGGTAFLGGAFTDIFGFKGGLRISALLTSLAVIMWIFLLPETRPESSSPQVPPQISGGKVFPWRLAISTAVPVFAVRFVFAGVMASTTILWLSEFIGDRISLFSMVVPIATFTGLLVAVRMAASVIGAPLAGLISDKVGYRWGVIAGGMILGALGIWMMGGSTFGLAVFGALVAAVASGGVQSLAPAIAGDHTNMTIRGKVLGLIYTFGDVGSALGPPLALTFAATVSVSTVYRLCAALFLSIALFAARFSINEARPVQY